MAQRINEAGRDRLRYRERLAASAAWQGPTDGRPPTYKCRWTLIRGAPMSTTPPENWSGYLRRMTSRPGWSVARLARESGIHRGTIFKWIKSGDGGVTVSSVRKIAAALGDDTEAALRAAALRAEIPAQAADEIDDEIAAIMSRTDIDDDAKNEIVHLVIERREEDRKRREAEAQRLIDWYQHRRREPQT